MSSHALNGKTALATGASSGPGVDFVRQLAEMGAQLVLVARREEQLNGVRAEIQAKHPVTVTVVAIDLSAPDVVRIALDAMLAGKPSVVPGFLDAASAWSNGLIPRRLSTIVAEKLMT